MTRRLDRTSAESADAVVARLVPPAFRQRYLRVLAKVIDLCADLPPGNWSVTLHHDGVTIDVGNLAVASLGKGAIRISLGGEATPRAKRRRDWHFSAVRGVFARFSHGPGPDNLDRISWPRVRRFIQSANEKYPKGNARIRRAHSPGLLKLLARALGRPVPGASRTTRRRDTPKQRVSEGVPARTRSRMETYLLTWNPKFNRPSLEDMAQEAARFRKRGKGSPWRWSFGSRWHVASDNRFYLMRLGDSPKGIVGSGRVVGKICENRRRGKKAPYADIEWQRLVDPNDPLPLEALQSDPATSSAVWTPRGSGVRIPEPAARRLEQLWRESWGVARAADREERRRSTGPGYAQDQAAKKAVEEHAMKAAIRCFRRDGYRVSDRSQGHSFDLECRRGMKILYVEVKGTTTAGEKVTLTAGEVDFARKHAQDMALFVLHEVDLRRRRGKPIVRGGRDDLRKPWDVDKGKLQATQYNYTLPARRQRRPTSPRSRRR